MKLSDLKSQMMVRTRDYYVFLVCGDVLTNPKECVEFLGYNNDMTHKAMCALDIIEVRECKLTTLKDIYKNFEEGDVIWVRDEEFDSKLDFANSLKNGDTIAVWNNGDNKKYIRIFKEYTVSNNEIKYITHNISEYKTCRWSNAQDLCIESLQEFIDNYKI